VEVVELEPEAATDGAAGTFDQGAQSSPTQSPTGPRRDVHRR
jgi:hypothetical protein